MNITYNFTRATSNVEMALLPADLAKELLQELAARLNKVPSETITRKHLQNLELANGNYEAFMIVASDFVTKRELIDNVSRENWDAYKVTRHEEIPA